MSRLIIPSVGLISRTFLQVGCRSVTVKGLPILLHALQDPKRKGIITVSNHISVLDDPLMWGILPIRHFFSSRNTRWSIGASDIMFTNPLFSQFFRWGQVIEVFRGQGIFQSAIDSSIQKLDQGEWIHIFPEGLVNQSTGKPINEHVLRFKWGIGRMCMEAQHIPIVIPIWISGFDQTMHQTRSFPRFLPRLNKHLTITIGDPSALSSQLGTILRGNIPNNEHIFAAKDEARSQGGLLVKGDPGNKPPVAREGVEGDIDTKMRIEVTRCIRNELVKLGIAHESGSG